MEDGANGEATINVQKHVKVGAKQNVGTATILPPLEAEAHATDHRTIQLTAILTHALV